MSESGFGKRDFFHPTIALVSEKKEGIVREWLENGQTDKAVFATGETPDEIGRDLLSAVVSEVWSCAWEKFRSVGADVLAKCFHDLKRSARKVLSGFGDPSVIDRVFDEGLVSILAAHAVATQNLTKEYKKAVDASAIVSIADAHGIITYANDKFCEISGYEREELIGKPHNIVRHPDMPKETFGKLWDTIRSKSVWRGIIKNLRKDGGYYWVRTTITPILCVNGEIREYISIRWKIPESTALSELGKI